MPQYDVGLILMRQLASGLAVPMILFDAAGDLLFYNEAAARLIGQPFEDVGDEMTLSGQRTVFALRDEKGQPLPDDQVPLAVAMRERRPVHRMVWGRSFDGIDRLVEITAFPLLGGGGLLIGAVAMFWERKPERAG